MAFKKAAQLTIPAEAIKEYAIALDRYSRAQKRYRPLKRLRDSENPLDVMRFVKAEDEWKRECKLFTAARKKYERIAMDARFRAKGIEPAEVSIYDLLITDVPLSGKDIIEDLKRQAAIASMPQEQFDAIYNAAKARQSTKEQFLSGSEATVGDQHTEHSSAKAREPDVLDALDKEFEV